MNESVKLAEAAIPEITTKDSKRGTSSINRPKVAFDFGQILSGFLVDVANMLKFSYSRGPRNDQQLSTRIATWLIEFKHHIV